MCGSAVLTTAMSSISIAVARQTTASVPVLLNISVSLRLVSSLGQVVEGGRRAEDLGAVLGEQPNELGHRRHHRLRRGLGARYGDTEGDEELLGAGGADRHQHPCTLGTDEVGVGDTAGDEAVVARLEFDPVITREHRDLALEDVERFVRVVMDVDRRPTSTRLVHHELREGVAGLTGTSLGGDSAALPPDVGETVAGGEAVRLCGDGGC